ncbi:MAG TPA: hypothetical protein VHU23_05925 [Rhizomicrobium sp.]|jgi:hypothetical protein|nr:hypothetical protein [Rhizomicrobium sp.]
MSYKVSYGKPPVHSQFRKGQSGNPGGRPGPRRAAERRVQAELEELLFLSPAEFARAAPRDGFGGVAADLTRGAAGGRIAAVRLLFSFVSERGMKRPRRARLPARIRQKLERAMSQGNPEAIAAERQAQGISPAPVAQAAVSPKGSRGGTENAVARRPRLPAMRNLRELRGARGRGCASQGITSRGSAMSFDSHKGTEGRELPRLRQPAMHDLREIHDIRGPPRMCEQSI